MINSSKAEKPKELSKEIQFKMQDSVLVELLETDQEAPVDIVSLKVDTS